MTAMATDRELDLDDDTPLDSDPLDPENMEKVSGRGLLLIRTFMDEVRFNDRGNEITLVWRQSQNGSGLL